MARSQNESHPISFRVNTPLYEWIARQGIPGESHGQTVQRLIKGLAAEHREGLIEDFSIVEFSQADLDAIEHMKVLMRKLVAESQL
jgi:hypothetical protein